MIVISADPWKKMVAHAEAAYPDECVGALLGRLGGDRKEVERALELNNAHEGSRRTRYTLLPEDLLQAEKEARASKLDVIGIYHSHPDAGAYFSKTDLENSCSWYSFVVVSVLQGEVADAKSFLPNDDQTAAPEEELRLPKGTHLCPPS